MKIVFSIFCFLAFFSGPHAFAKYEMRIRVINYPQNGIFYHGDSIELGAYFIAEGYEEPMDSVFWFLNGNRMGTTTDYKTIKFNTPGIITAMGIPSFVPILVSAEDTFLFSPVPFTLPVTLNVKLFLDGYYRGGGFMVAAMDPVGHSGICDSVIVELHDVDDPYRIGFVKKVAISITGNGSFILPPQVYEHAYYIVVRHRNSIETWSKNPILFNRQTVDFDFTSP